MEFEHKEFKTETEAIGYRSWFLDRFHPAGYGSHATIRYISEKDVWCVDTARYTSCD